MAELKNWSKYKHMKKHIKIQNEYGVIFWNEIFKIYSYPFIFNS